MTKLTTPRSILIGFALIALSIASIPYSNLIVPKAYAEVAGMDYYDLKGDYDLKKAVKSIVERYCTASGWVDTGGDWLYGAEISC